MYYSHTLIVMVTLAFLTIKAINNPAIIGLSSFYDVLVEVDKTRDIAGNYRALYSHSSLKVLLSLAWCIPLEILPWLSWTLVSGRKVCIYGRLHIYLRS